MSTGPLVLFCEGEIHVYMGARRSGIFSCFFFFFFLSCLGPCTLKTRLLYSWYAQKDRCALVESAREMGGKEGGILFLGVGWTSVIAMSGEEVLLVPTT